MFSKLIRKYSGARVRSNGVGFGYLPLQSAISGHQEYIAKLLIQNGAELNNFDLNGCSPICYAAEYGANEIVELLIENGADIDAQDKFKMNALHYAVLNNHPKTAITLLSCSASLTVKNNQGDVPIEATLKTVDSAAFKSLLNFMHSI